MRRRRGVLWRRRRVGLVAEALFCVDMGTTRTRAWLVNSVGIDSERAADIGERNVAAGESRQWLEAQLCRLLEETYRERRTHMVDMPAKVIAAGMITSAQGLIEVPHVAAPAGEREIRAAVERHKLRDWELMLVPGVKTAGAADVAGALETDVMRGEETLAVGLLSAGVLRANNTLVTLGSHWKWIAVNAEGRIAGSRTSMCGELIHAVQANTLLAAALPQMRPESFELDWVEMGVREVERTSLGRALFCVRLLELRGVATAEQRLSFFYGTMLEGELREKLKRLERGVRPVRILVSGSEALAMLWQRQLMTAGHFTEVLAESDREAAYLYGLRTLAGMG